jgi:hypothetical protein
MTTQLSLPNPFPTSANLCQFQKGSGVVRSDATGCEVPCLDAGAAADELQNLFPSLDDTTIWTAQAAIVGSCDECIYGPVEATLRDFVGNLHSVCCLDSSCLVGIINAILCNPILNYRARFLEAQHAVAQVRSQNEEILRAYSAAQAQVQATNSNICAIVSAVKEAISRIPQDGGQGTQTRCCLAGCLNNLCGQLGGSPPPPTTLPLPCPCPPISCEALANACVVIKVACAPCGQLGGSGITCDESIKCQFIDPQTGQPCGGIGGSGIGNVTVGGITYPGGCLLPTGEAYKPTSGQGCHMGEKAIVLTFRGAQQCVTGFGTGVVGSGSVSILPPYINQQPNGSAGQNF